MEEQVACHRLVPNGIGRPVQGAVIKPTQWLIAKNRTWNTGGNERKKDRSCHYTLITDSKVLLRGGPDSVCVCVSTVLCECAAIACCMHMYVKPSAH